MVTVAQLVESRIVIPVVVGSSPIGHPIFGPLAQLVEQRTLNPFVVGSTPTWPTKINQLAASFPRKITSAGLLRDSFSQTLLAASIKLVISAEE